MYIVRACAEGASVYKVRNRVVNNAAIQSDGFDLRGMWPARRRYTTSQYSAQAFQRKHCFNSKHSTRKEENAAADCSHIATVASGYLHDLDCNIISLFGRLYVNGYIGAVSRVTRHDSARWSAEEQSHTHYVPTGLWQKKERTKPRHLCTPRSSHARTEVHLAPYKVTHLVDSPKAAMANLLEVRKDLGRVHLVEHLGLVRGRRAYQLARFAHRSLVKVDAGLLHARDRSKNSDCSMAHCHRQTLAGSSDVRWQYTFARRRRLGGHSGEAVRSENASNCVPPSDEL
jgi:hypothetical protein